MTSGKSSPSEDAEAAAKTKKVMMWLIGNNMQYIVNRLEHSRFA